MNSTTATIKQALNIYPDNIPLAISELHQLQNVRNLHLFLETMTGLSGRRSGSQWEIKMLVLFLEKLQRVSSRGTSSSHTNKNNEELCCDKDSDHAAGMPS